VGRTIRTCSLVAALLVGAASPALADVRPLDIRSKASTFVAAQAAADAGDARRAANLFAALAAASPGDRNLAGRALAQAILGGDMPMALRLARSSPPGQLDVEARLLLAADRLKASEGEKVVTAWPPELAFLTPFVRAWSLAERGRWREGVALLDAVPSGSSLRPLVSEHKALILLAAGQAAAARPLTEPALRTAGARANRLRVVFAQGIARAGDRATAMSLLQGRDVTLTRAAAAIASNPKPALSVATASQGFAELLTGLAIGLNGNESGQLPLAVTQIAHFADPSNEETTILLALLLEKNGRPDDGVALLRAVPDDALFASEAHDAEIRMLVRDDREQEALARAQVYVADPQATADDWSRLGDVLDAMDRHAQAAEAFGKALALVQAGGPGPELWSLHLLRGSALEQSGNWPEAEKSLEAARALVPDNPVVLNYLGYARLERGVKMDEAERLIAEASRRAPDDASITDSLGWAQFKRGRVDEAIATLQRAAAADPAQAEVNEHLGDALYTAGRRYEARFAWNAALVTAEDKVKARVEAKLAAGLTPATAAP